MVPSTSDSGYTFTSKLHPPRGETQRDDGCGSSKISRKWFTDWLASWLDKDVIKVVTGIRRCGKTTLFELFREQLVESGRPCYFQVAYTVRDEATPPANSRRSNPSAPTILSSCSRSTTIRRSTMMASIE